MMFSTRFVSSLLVAAAAFATSTNAVPVSGPQELIVYAPPVTAPAAGAVWPVGSTQKVTWDISNIPEEAKNTTGLVLLGHQDGDDGGENLDIAHPLATGFPMSSGSVDVKVPSVDARTDYIIVLIGDSGDKSDKFSIVGA